MQAREVCPCVISRPDPGPVVHDSSGHTWRLRLETLCGARAVAVWLKSWSGVEAGGGPR